jgi:hypothetical protein
MAGVGRIRRQAQPLEHASPPSLTLSAPCDCFSARRRISTAAHDAQRCRQRDKSVRVKANRRTKNALRY